jgi:MFS family permease
MATQTSSTTQTVGLDGIEPVNAAARLASAAEDIRNDALPTPPTAAAASPGTTPPRPSAASAAAIMLPLCLSVTLSALDLTIVTPAIPAIVSSFPSSSSSASTAYVWIGSAFILASTAGTPVAGAVADIWGRKPILLGSVAIFLAGSLLCALAPTADSVVAGRAVQGLGAAGMGTMVNVIICDSFSLRDRGLYLAITSGIWAVVSAVGPVIGGVVTTWVGWRWCFWINCKCLSGLRLGL